VRRLLVLGATSAIACGNFELVPTSERDLSALLYVNVQDQVGATNYTVQLTIDPGRDTNGDVRDIGLPTLFVEGATVVPARKAHTDESLYLLYDWARTRDSTQSQLDSLHIGLPMIGAQPMTSWSIVIPLVRRAGAAIVNVSNGDVRFDITPFAPDSLALGRAHLSWQLEMPRSCRNNTLTPVVLMRGEGSVPGELAVTRASFAGVSDSTTACLVAQSFGEPTTSSYHTFIINSSQIEWRVRIP